MIEMAGNGAAGRILPDTGTEWPVPESVTAYCPGHLSGYFRPVTGTRYATTGSEGAGIVIEEGVFVRATPSETIKVTAKRLYSDGSVRELFHDAPPLTFIAERLGVRVHLETECRLPIGAGFGLSAAALMASVAAINRLFCMGMTVEHCAELAHEAEIVHRTGLGDVAACQGGGRDFRTHPGIRGGIVRFFDMHDPLYAVNLGPLPSPQILGSAESLTRICSAYPSDYPGSPEKFFELSFSFAEKSGLLSPELRDILSHCAKEGIPASMTMLGNGVFAMGEGARDVLASWGEVLELHVASCGLQIGGGNT